MIPAVAMMRPTLPPLLAGLLFLMGGAAAAGTPVKVVFDTDMASDVDDVGALATLHALADLGEAEILAAGISSRNEHVGPCLDAINTWYGRPDLPIGYQRGIQVGYPNGRCEDGEGEYNVQVDTAASVRAIHDWPTPVVFSGFEIGARVFTGARLRAAPETSPVRAAYLHFNGLANRQSWDQTAVLYAVRGPREYWTESEPGLCLMHARVGFGYNDWVSAPRMSRRYLIERMAPPELARVIEDLMTRPPR